MLLLRRNGFSAACEVGNCCYRSFASVASNVFILLRMFSVRHLPATVRADRAGKMVTYARSLSGIAVRDEAKEVRLDARPQARKNRRCIRWNTLGFFRAENDADGRGSFAAVERSMSDRLLGQRTSVFQIRHAACWIFA